MQRENIETFLSFYAYIIIEDTPKTLCVKRGVNMTEDKKLIWGIKEKKRGALETVIERYTPYVSTVVYNTAGLHITREDIEEAVLDTFLSLWRNADTFDCKKGSLRTYLGAIARNLATDKMRRIKSSEELDENMTAIYGEPYEKLEMDEEREMMIRLIGELGEPDSEIFMRYYYYDEKISYISKIMGIKNSTVKTKLARGRKRLKNILEGRA